MNMQIAKMGRMKALEKSNGDRVLVEAAKGRDDLRLPDQGTVAAYLIDAISENASVEQIVAETGWSKSTVMVNLFKVAKRSGVGIRRSNGKLSLILPADARDMYPPQRDVTRRFNHGSQMSGPVITGLAMS